MAAAPILCRRRRQKADDRIQRSENRKQKAEDGCRKTEISLTASLKIDHLNRELDFALVEFIKKRTNVEYRIAEFFLFYYLKKQSEASGS